MPGYFMRDTPLQALEQLMMSQPGQKPRGGGIYRSPFHYTPKDVACEYCQNYVRKHPCRLCECTCLEERIEAGVLELNSFVRDCFAPSMGSQLRKRMRQQFREKKAQFFLSDAHRRRWTHWRERCWRLSDRNKAALFLLTAYESLWRRMVWKCGNDGFDFQSVCLGGIEPELYSVYQAAKAIAVGCCNITLADLASPELVTDEAFHLITGALLMAKYLSTDMTNSQIMLLAAKCIPIMGSAELSSYRVPADDAYGWTKYMIEQIITDYAAATPDFSAVIFRYFNPVGAHPSGLIGEAPNGAPNNLMPYITQVATGKRKQISVFGADYDTPDGTCIRDYIHIMDIAAGHTAALPFCTSHKGVEVINLGTGMGHSVLELISAFENATGIHIPFQIVGRRAGDIPVCFASAEKAKALLGWQATRTLSDMCRDAWNWQQKNPDGFMLAG